MHFYLLHRPVVDTAPRAVDRMGSRVDVQALTSTKTPIISTASAFSAERSSAQQDHIPLLNGPPSGVMLEVMTVVTLRHPTMAKIRET